MVKESLQRQRRRKLIAVAAVALGAMVVTALLSVTVEVKDQINRELTRYGANLLMYPSSSHLVADFGDLKLRPENADQFIEEAALAKIKSVFWRHNIVAFSPFLYVPVQLSSGARCTLVGTWFEQAIRSDDGERFVTGVRSLNPSWQVQGDWVRDDDDGSVLVGSTLAKRLGLRPGDRIWASYGVGPRKSSASFRIKGILNAEDQEDDQILAPLRMVQLIAGLQGKVHQVRLSALTKPEDDLARKDPRKMTPVEFDKWYCSPYVSAIAYQLKEAIPGVEVRPIRRVAETQGFILGKVEHLLFVITLAALVCAGLAVASTMSASLLERRVEIGLLKALGASNLNVLTIFVLESVFLGFVGGALGFLLGTGLAQLVSINLFNTTVPIKLILLPAIISAAIAVTLLGSAVSFHRAVQVEPALALREQ